MACVHTFPSLEENISPSKTFPGSVLDYAGPFLLKDKKKRNPKLTKALFVCFCTKPKHIEVVSDLCNQ